MNKRWFAGGIGLLALGFGLASCSQASVPPAQVPAQIRQIPSQQAPGLYFTPYGDGLVRPRWSHTADVIGQWLYVVGGADTDGQMASVERAPILDGGELGAFRPAASSLVTPRDCHASLVIGNWLYVFGGDRQGSLDTVERAPIKGGDLGRFQMASSRLTTGRDEHTATRVGKYVYLIGGIRGPFQLDSIERAEVNADGSLGPFSRYKHTLTAHRYGHWVVVQDGYLYVVSGLSDNGDSGVAERARIGSDGELGPFERVGSSLGERRDSPIVMAFNGWLYVIAGARENAMHIKLNSIEAAPFTGGGLGAFRSAGWMQEGRDYHTVTRVGDWLYTVAGEKTGGGAIGSVERARVPAPGSAPTVDSTGGRWGDYYW